MKQKKLTTAVMMIALLFAACGKNDDPTPQPQNQAPLASAGDDRQAEIGSTVMLDASASTDADGDDLTYKWTFAEKPEESDAVIMGALDTQAEFLLDKAGTYIVNLVVNDGKLTTTASVTITNKAPILNTIDSKPGIDGLDKNLVRRGKTLNISGDFFSGNIEENIVMLGGIICGVQYVDNIDAPTLLNISIPEEAVGGDLVITVGPHSATWPEPIQIMSLPAQDFVAQDPNLEQRLRTRDAGNPEKWKEIGFKFRPLKNGSILAFYNSAKDKFSDLRVTLWDASNNMEFIAQAKFETIGEGSYLVLDTPISLEAGKEYILSTFSETWYNYIYAVPETIYPRTIHNIQIMEGRTSMGFASGQPDSVFPDMVFDHFMPIGADMIFVEDLEQE